MLFSDLTVLATVAQVLHRNTLALGVPTHPGDVALDSDAVIANELPGRNLYIDVQGPAPVMVPVSRP